ncbi:hypothetical protein, partial [Corynebacterium casei]|uniref:hypothetical protein n=1 Tax=Corynebacterium casei TaxID=160386 RepID=UPI0026482935
MSSKAGESPKIFGKIRQSRQTKSGGLDLKILCLNIGEQLRRRNTYCAVPFFIQTQVSNWRISWPL